MDINGIIGGFSSKPMVSLPEAAQELGLTSDAGGEWMGDGDGWGWRMLVGPFKHRQWMGNHHQIWNHKATILIVTIAIRINYDNQKKTHVKIDMAMDQYLYIPFLVG